METIDPIRPGYIYYDTSRAYEGEWKDAVKHIGQAVQVLDAVGSLVTFQVLKPNADKSGLVVVGEKQNLKLDEFRKLIASL